jgi:hypothetical protein
MGYFVASSLLPEQYLDKLNNLILGFNVVATSKLPQWLEEIIRLYPKMAPLAVFVSSTFKTSNQDYLRTKVQDSESAINFYKKIEEYLVIKLLINMNNGKEIHFFTALDLITRIAHYASQWGDLPVDLCEYIMKLMLVREADYEMNYGAWTTEQKREIGDLIKRLFRDDAIHALASLHHMSGIGQFCMTALEASESEINTKDREPPLDQLEVERTSRKLSSFGVFDPEKDQPKVQREKRQNEDALDSIDSGLKRTRGSNL